MNPYMKQTCFFINKMNKPAKLTREDIINLNKDIKSARYIFDL